MITGPSVNYELINLSFQINLGIYMKDNNTELSLLVDRSVGGSSIVDGQLELMLHRFMLFFTLDLLLLLFILFLTIFSV